MKKFLLMLAMPFLALSISAETFSTSERSAKTSCLLSTADTT